MEKSGLILEGGGLRGVFSSGVLDYMMENDIVFPYVIGVSMGALNGASYVSKQIGRSLRVPMTFMGDSRYLSLKNFIIEGSYFGMNFIFDKIVNELDPFDFDSFEKSNQRFIAVAANCNKGTPEYFDKDNTERYKMLQALMASSSLPYISKMIEIDNNFYLDGGIIDSIPIKKALSDKVQKPVVILTRPIGYRKKDSGIALSKIIYRKYPKLLEMIKNKATIYNNQLELIENLEKENKVFVIRPYEAIKVARTEKNKEKLKSAYDYGYETMKKEEARLKNWLSSF